MSLPLLLKTEPQNPYCISHWQVTCDAGWWVSKTQLLFQSLQGLPNLRHIWSRKACVRFFLSPQLWLVGFSVQNIPRSLSDDWLYFRFTLSTHPCSFPFLFFFPSLPLGVFFYTWDFPCFAEGRFSCCLAASLLPDVSFGDSVLYA